MTSVPNALQERHSNTLVFSDIQSGDEPGFNPSRFVVVQVLYQYTSIFFESLDVSCARRVAESPTTRSSMQSGNWETITGQEKVDISSSQ